MLLASGVANPRLYPANLEPRLAADRAEQPVRPTDAAACVRWAGKSRHYAVRRRKLSEYHWNADARCGTCGWQSALQECQWCGVRKCPWCMAGEGAQGQQRRFCLRCPALDQAGLTTRPVPPLCELCRGWGIAPAQARLSGAAQPAEWAEPVVQCTQCHLHICLYCKHTEVNECKKCAVAEDAPKNTRPPELPRHVLDIHWAEIEWWRSGRALRTARERTAEADAVALHEPAGRSQAAEILRQL